MKAVKGNWYPRRYKGMISLLHSKPYLGTPSKMKSPEIRLVFECKLHTLLKMFSKDNFSSQVSRQWEVEPGLPGFLCNRPSSIATGSPHGCLAHSCSKQGERKRGKDKGGRACGRSSQPLSHPFGKNWCQDDFSPLKKSEEQNEEKEGVNHWGGHLLSHLHPQPQEVPCNSVNLATVVWLRMPP